MFHAAIAHIHPDHETEDSNTDGLRAAVPPRILLIEDNPLIAELVELTLIEEGFRVVGIAETAERAVQLARLYKPDLAITDIRLSGPRDGVEAALDILRLTGTRSIFATGHLDGEMVGRCAEAKPLGWLTKPYTPGQVVEAVRQALGSVAVEM